VFNQSSQNEKDEPRNLGERSVPDHLWPVLEQLVVGATDLTASRRLNMSPRTFSRRVAELLESLGVRTRFQGGVEVAHRDLLRQRRPTLLTRSSQLSSPSGTGARSPKGPARGLPD
jgi:DNA-binding NarL/FixJ family response regulator